MRYCEERKKNVEKCHVIHKISLLASTVKSAT